MIGLKKCSILSKMQLASSNGFETDTIDKIGDKIKYKNIINKCKILENKSEKLSFIKKFSNMHL